MKAKTVLLTGLNAGCTEDEIREWMQRFGTVTRLQLVRDGNAAAPVALVEMRVSEAEAFVVSSRISNYWHGGSLVNARLMMH